MNTVPGFMEGHGDPWPDAIEALANPLRDTARALEGVASWLDARTASPRAFTAPSSARAVAMECALAKEILRTRGQREAYFGMPIFGEPAWDMILDLFISHEERRSVSISGLAVVAGVPGSTAYRWIERMTSMGLLIQTPDETDGRRTFVTLEREFLSKVRSYLSRAAGRYAALGGYQARSREGS